MANILASGRELARQACTAHLATAVTYVRGLTQIATVATVGATPFDEIDNDGMVMRVETRDYIFDASALQIGGQPITPVPGDRVLESVGGKTRSHVVASVGGSQCYRYLGGGRELVRVHTKFVDEY